MTDKFHVKNLIENSTLMGIKIQINFLFGLLGDFDSFEYAMREKFYR